MRSTGGFERAEGIAAATEALCALDLTTLSDEQITRLLQSAETVRRRLDGLDARTVAQVHERGMHKAVKLSTSQKYWTTTPGPYGGRPLWTAPHLLDLSRSRRRNHGHHPHELIANATAAATTR
jgi:hypothetical protein